MAAIKTVAVVGGSGNLGRPLVQELLDAGFQVTALARESSTATYPEGVAVRTVDFSSSESLKGALAGQDAVVSTIATLAIGSQTTIIDAAFDAGVKRFIPSEFGVNTRALENDPGLKLILSGKIKTADYLQELAAKKAEFTWTGISTGLFFDWGLGVGSLGFINKSKTATIVDSGNEPFPASNLYYIGKAVAAVLKHPSETANKYLTVASFNPTQNQILKAFEELTGSEWKVNHLDTAELRKIGDEKLAKKDFSAFGELLKVHLFADGHGHGLKPSESANGLIELPEEDLKGSIKKWLADSGAV